MSVVVCAGVLLNLRFSDVAPKMKSFAVQLPERAVFVVSSAEFETRKPHEHLLSENATYAAVPSPAAALAINTTTLTAFVESGGRFPILLLTRKRVSELNATISSLLSVRGVEREAVFVIQDGSEPGIKDVVASYGLRCYQKTEREAIPNSVHAVLDIRGFRIASHFRFSFDYMFTNVTEVC
jgi:hypothetical protein